MVILVFSIVGEKGHGVELLWYHLLWILGGWLGSGHGVWVGLIIIGIEIQIVDSVRNLLKHQGVFSLFAGSLGFVWWVEWGLAKNGRRCIIFAVFICFVELLNFLEFLIVLAVVIKSWLAWTVDHILTKLELLALWRSVLDEVEVEHEALWLFDSVTSTLVYRFWLNQQLVVFLEHWTTLQLFRCSWWHDFFGVTNSLTFLWALMTFRQVNVLLKSFFWWCLIQTLVTNQTLVAVRPDGTLLVRAVLELAWVSVEDIEMTSFSELSLNQLWFSTFCLDFFCFLAWVLIDLILKGGNTKRCFWLS